MSAMTKNSARLRDEERARLIWLLTTDKAIISALSGKLTLAEQYDVGTLADDIAEVGALVAHLPPPDLADTLEALPSEERHALWRLVENEKRGKVLLEASENVWDDLIDEMTDRAHRATAGDAAAGGARPRPSGYALREESRRGDHGVRGHHRAPGRDAGGGAALFTPSGKNAGKYRQTLCNEPE